MPLTAITDLSVSAADAAAYRRLGLAVREQTGVSRFAVGAGDNIVSVSLAQADGRTGLHAVRVRGTLPNAVENLSAELCGVDLLVGTDDQLRPVEVPANAF